MSSSQDKPPANYRWWKRWWWWPWPSRAERQANVSLALKTAASSRRAARKAEVLAADLRSMEADALASAIIEGLQLDPGTLRGERGSRDERGPKGDKGERGGVS